MVIICFNSQASRKAIKSVLLLASAIPAKAMPFPGANAAGDFSHASKFDCVHFIVAFEERAPL